MTKLKLKLKLKLQPSPIRKRSKAAPTKQPVETYRGAVPRISKLMALAIEMDDLLRDGEVQDLAELASLGHVTQPRISQILNLTLLAPDIQEKLLSLPLVTRGKSPIHEKMLRPVAAEVNWATQRAMYERL